MDIGRTHSYIIDLEHFSWYIYLDLLTGVKGAKGKVEEKLAQQLEIKSTHVKVNGSFNSEMTLLNSKMTVLNYK